MLLLLLVSVLALFFACLVLLPLTLNSQLLLINSKTICPFLDQTRATSLHGTFQERSSHPSDAFKAAKAEVREFIITYIHELKHQAFKAVFVEPTKAYFRGIQNYGPDEDVVVVGVHT